MTSRYAIIENNLVTNVVVASAEIASEHGWIACPNAGPGWKFVNGEFVKPDLVVIEAPPAPTKEQLLAQLQALQQQIQSLE